MKIGIVIYSDDPETVWNAFRFGNFALNKGDKTKVFLMGKGVKCESLNTDKFNITKQIYSFTDNGDKILACGSCLKIHQTEDSKTCKFSSMEDFYAIVKESDKIVTF